MRSRGRVLIVAGSDSGGGAGIQADIKTVTALGGYAGTAVTAVTVQNTLGVQDIHPIPPDIVSRQMHAVLDDIGADAIKTGMLHNAATVAAVAKAIEEAGAAIPLIVDPVMVAKGGACLLDEEARTLLLERLLPRAALVTPNVPELSAMTGLPVSSIEEMNVAAQSLMETGVRAVLAKGGHLPGDYITDIFLTDGEESHFSVRRISTRHTHGTGCTLASAIATGIAQGMAAIGATIRARHYLTLAIEAAPGFGKGVGPLAHGHPCVEKRGQPNRPVT